MLRSILLVDEKAARGQEAVPLAQQLEWTLTMQQLRRYGETQIV
jgi:hypothetical protein